MDPSYACEAGEISIAEAFHNSEEYDSADIEDPGIEAYALRSDNHVALRINSEFRQKTPKSSLKIGHFVYEIFKEKGIVYAQSDSEKICLGKTEQEVRINLRHLKRQLLTPIGVLERKCGLIPALLEY